jgi:ankyrin repeat protein
LNDEKTSTFAAKKGNFEIIKKIFEKNNILGEFALHWACYNGYLEIAKYLKNNGAKVDKTVKDWATAGKHKKIIHLKISQKESNSLDYLIN